jgi:hypothetical protein
VSVDGTPPNQGIQISFKLNRPDTPANKESWLHLLDPRGFRLTDGWRWPNLAGVFNARGDMRYGGEYLGVDNDFGAVVVRRQKGSTFGMPLVSADWANDNGVTDLHSISHDIHVKEKFSLRMTHGLCRSPAPVELWFALLDNGRNAVRGWPREWDGIVFLHVTIDWKESFGTGLEPVFQNSSSAPPPSPMQMLWQAWKKGGAHPNYIDIDTPL